MKVTPVLAFLGALYSCLAGFLCSCSGPGPVAGVGAIAAPQPRASHRCQDQAWQPTSPGAPSPRCQAGAAGFSLSHLKPCGDTAPASYLHFPCFVQLVFVSLALRIR